MKTHNLGTKNKRTGVRSMAVGRSPVVHARITHRPRIVSPADMTRSWRGGGGGGGGGVGGRVAYWKTVDTNIFYPCPRRPRVRPRDRRARNTRKYNIKASARAGKRSPSPLRPPTPRARIERLSAGPARARTYHMCVCVYTVRSVPPAAAVRADTRLLVASDDATDSDQSVCGRRRRQRRGGRSTRA